MSQGDVLRANQVFNQLQKQHGFYGKYSTIKLPYIYKLEKQESKNLSQSQEKPCVIKLFERTAQIKQIFRKIRPALLALYKIFPNQENVAQLQTDLLQLKGSKFYFVKYKHFGESFKQFLEEQKYPFDDKSVLNYCLQVAKGLAQLQYVGINHRDVKVSNVIMVDNKTLKVIDFDISKTQRSTQSIKQMTNNKATLCYSSPWRLLQIKGESVKTQNTGFRDDTYSFGLLMLEVAFNKTRMQKPLKKFLDSEILGRIDQKSYNKLIENLMNQFNKAKNQFSLNTVRIIELSFSLLCFDSDLRIDLLAVYKCLKYLSNNQPQLLEQFFKEQIKEVNKRQYIEDQEFKGVQCLGKLVREKYIQDPQPQKHSFQKVQRSDARLATLNEKRNKIIVFNYNGKQQSADIFDQTSCGTRVVSTDRAAFILGGEDDATGNCLTLNLSCKYSNMSLSHHKDIPDEGRSSFGVAFSFEMNIIPLVGGFMRNCKFAETVLTYLPAKDIWILNAKLKQKRVSPSCCFAKQYFYVFGGMVESGSFDVKHSESIEKFSVKSLAGKDGASGQIVEVSKIPKFLKFIARTDSLAFHLQEEEILVLGGINDDEEDLQEAYRIDFKGKEVFQVSEPMRNAQTSFYSPGIYHRGDLYVADQHIDGAQMYVGTFDRECKSINFEIKCEIK